MTESEPRHSAVIRRRIEVKPRGTEVKTSTKELLKQANAYEALGINYHELKRPVTTEEMISAPSWPLVHRDFPHVIGTLMERVADATVLAQRAPDYDCDRLNIIEDLKGMLLQYANEHRFSADNIVIKPLLDKIPSPADKADNAAAVSMMVDKMVGDLDKTWARLNDRSPTPS